MTVDRIQLRIVVAGIVWLLARGATLRTAGGHIPNTPSGSTRAATAVLLQLEVVVESSSLMDVSKCYLQAAEGTLSREECALRLASMPKPVRCYGGVRDSVLTVDCQPVDGAFLRVASQDFVRELSEQYGGVVGQARLLVKGRHDRLLLTTEEAAEMFRDYSVFFASRRLRAPNEAERAEGATAVLSVHASRAGPANVTIKSDTGE